MKLNGWQRLWVVVTLIWVPAVLVVFVNGTEWPRASWINQWEIYNELNPTAKRALVPPVGAEVTGWDFSGLENENFFVPLKPIDVGDAHVLEFRGGTTAAEVQRIGGEFQAARQHLVLVRRVQLVARVAAWCVLPAALLYALGWAFVWVRRGFVGVGGTLTKDGHEAVQ